MSTPRTKPAAAAEQASKSAEDTAAQQADQPEAASAESQAELDALQKNVLSRLKKIEGQIRGIQGMVRAGQECEHILIQVRAVNSALRSTSRIILKRYLEKCHAEAMRSSDSETAHAELDKVIGVLANFIDG